MDTQVLVSCGYFLRLSKLLRNRKEPLQNAFLNLKNIEVITMKDFFTAQSESLFSSNQLWPPRICWVTNREIYCLTSDLRVIVAICRATRKICFLTAPKHSFLMTQALVTWLRACAHDVMCPCCGGGGGQIGEQIHPKNSGYKLD